MVSHSFIKNGFLTSILSKNSLFLFALHPTTLTNFKELLNQNGEQINQLLINVANLFDNQDYYIFGR